jgi:hypothetical protein
LAGGSKQPATHRAADSTPDANCLLIQRKPILRRHSVAKHLHLYLDDSGSRDLDRPITKASQRQGTPWFALGGVLVREEDEAIVRAAYADFCNRWGIAYPLHSWEIRNRQGNFGWLRAAPSVERDRFLSGLSAFMTAQPLRVTACVVNRAGYDARYRQLHGQRRWKMSKTAFTIVVERAAKIAQKEERQLKVWFEEHSKAEDQAVIGYFNDMKAHGMPFDPKTSHSYSPLDSSTLTSVLSSCQRKKKSSPLVQLADLVLFAVCKGRYTPNYSPYQMLVGASMLVDQHLPAADCATMGIKYSCFD